MTVGNLSPYYHDSKKAHEQRQEDRNNSLDMAEHEGYLHTTVDCFERNNLPRRMQELSLKESAFREGNTFNVDESHERIILMAVQMLFKTEDRPNPDESLSNFIERINTNNM